MNKYSSFDKYSYPGTDVLINNENIIDSKKLEIVEGAFSRARLQELSLNPLEGNFDLQHLQSIHKYIFQDIYPFAGKIRDVGIIKGTTEFCKPQYIHSYAEELFNSLKQENYLKGLKFEKFTERLSYYYSEINMLHCFREGNGRSQKKFIENLSAKKAGYQLDWTRINKEQLLTSTIESVLDRSKLENVLASGIVNKIPQPNILKAPKRSWDLER